MSSADRPDAASEDSTAPDRAQCTACRGTGRVQSGLGGAQHEVQCPWCGGSGAYQPGRDAQQHVAEPSA